jgi:hypothetical protein
MSLYSVILIWRHCNIIHVDLITDCIKWGWIFGRERAQTYSGVTQSLTICMPRQLGVRCPSMNRSCFPVARKLRMRRPSLSLLHTPPALQLVYLFRWVELHFTRTWAHTHVTPGTPGCCCTRWHKLVFSEDKISWGIKQISVMDFTGYQTVQDMTPFAVTPLRTSNRNQRSHASADKYTKCHLYTSSQPDSVRHQSRSPLAVARLGVFSVVTMKNRVLWDVTPCDSCKNRRFGGT